MVLGAVAFLFVLRKPGKLDSDALQTAEPSLQPLHYHARVAGHVAWFVVLSLTIGFRSAQYDRSGKIRSAQGHSNHIEYLIRFVFGGAGLVCVAAGLIAKKFGPGVGGLFLAFPAIFPAGASLVESHERKKTQGPHGNGWN